MDAPRNSLTVRDLPWASAHWPLASLCRDPRKRRKRVVIGHSAFMADQANSGPYFQRRDLLWSHSAPRKKTQTWRKMAGLIVRAGTQLNPGLRAISAIRSNAAITSTHGQNQRFCRSGHDIRIDIYNPAKSIAAMMAGPSAMNPNSAKPSETAIPNAAATNTSMVVRSRKRRLEGRLDVCTWTCLQAVAMAASGRYQSLTYITGEIE